MTYELPGTAEIGGIEYDIRSDYRAALDIIGIMNDQEISDEERAFLVLYIFFPDFDDIPKSDYQEAINFVYWFIGGGDEQEEKQRKPRLIDWEQDFTLIVSPVNRVLGKEIRAEKYLHWWTFLSAYYEIGECLFSQVVGIRTKKAKHRKLDKADQEFYKQNRKLIDFKQELTHEEQETMDAWMI